MKIIASTKIVSGSILFTALKFLDILQPPKFFDKICDNLNGEKLHDEVNQLSAIIFKLILSSKKLINKI